jgi:hypothetical protein
VPVLVRNVIAPLVLHLAERVRVHIRMIEDWLLGQFIRIKEMSLAICRSGGQAVAAGYTMRMYCSRQLCRASP